MGKTKQLLCNMQAQLEQVGIRLETISRLKFNNIEMPTLGTEYTVTMRDLDAQQNCNKYKWRGLPDNMPSWLIEYMLYMRGSLCGFISGGALYILPYAQQKGLNIYGMPNAIQPITFNGAMAGGSPSEKFGKELPVNNFGDINKEAKACILYDRIPVFSTNSSPIGRCTLNSALIEFQCQVLGQIKNNLRNIDKKAVFWVDTEAQKNQLDKDLAEAYGSEKPDVIAVKGSNVADRQPTDVLQGDIANETQSLFETWQSINSIRCMCSGIANGGAFEKKERKITGELQGDETQTEIVIDAGLQMRRLFIEQMKNIYPEYLDILGKITVEINERTIEYEEEDTDFSTEGVDNE